jgi:hypothetical protein
LVVLAVVVVGVVAAFVECVAGVIALAVFVAAAVLLLLVCSGVGLWLSVLRLWQRAWWWWQERCIAPSMANDRMIAAASMANDRVIE